MNVYHKAYFSADNTVIHQITVSKLIPGKPAEFVDSFQNARKDKVLKRYKKMLTPAQLDTLKKMMNANADCLIDENGKPSAADW
ncbi:hypothetical protein V9K67_20860 [Paraflavisolibacter sp. H34]|uniref:hypothetical protein n=1 Tax=Huijunlia imazamoxiresistens TaxID=3127457 RepID=UPI003019A387